MANPASLSDLPGKLKLLTVILGLIAMGLHADNYHEVSKEEFYLAMLIIAFILSFLLVVCSFLGLIPHTDMWKKIDIAYHMIMAVLLAISLILMIVSMADFSKWNSGLKSMTWYKKWAAKASFAVIFGGINTLLYAVIGFFLYRTL